MRRVVADAVSTSMHRKSLPVAKADEAQMVTRLLDWPFTMRAATVVVSNNVGIAYRAIVTHNVG